MVSGLIELMCGLAQTEQKGSGSEHVGVVMVVKVSAQLAANDNGAEHISPFEEGYNFVESKMLVLPSTLCLKFGGDE